MKIGIPRALTFYWFFPFWEAFFNSLKIKIITSPVTNKHILNSGLRLAVDEACLPVKVFLGHVNYLKDKVDLLFIPGIKSMEKRKYYCPNIIAISETTCALIKNPILKPEIYSYNHDFDWLKCYLTFALEIGYSYSTAKKAVENGLRKHNYFISKLENGSTFQEAMQETIRDPIYHLEVEKNDNYSNDKLQIVILGHPYLIEDSYINFNLKMKLNNKGIIVKTPYNITPKIVDYHTNFLEKELFWNYSRYMIAAASYYSKDKPVDGFIFLNSFGCGTNAIIEPYLYLLTKDKPVLTITLDEHTSATGVDTRIEAFLDMVIRHRRQIKDERQNKSSFSKNGAFTYRSGSMF